MSPVSTKYAICFFSFDCNLQRSWQEFGQIVVSTEEPSRAHSGKTGGLADFLECGGGREGLADLSFQSRHTVERDNIFREQTKLWNKDSCYSESRVKLGS